MEHQPASVLYEALVSEWHLAGFAAETLGVPVVVHGFNDSANDELPTLATARGKQDMEVVLTVLAAFKLHAHTKSSLIQEKPKMVLKQLLVAL